MDALKLIEELSRHPVIKNDMDIQMQLGLPFLEKKDDKLMLSFKAHKEVFRNGNMEYYEPLYDVSWVYPSKRMVYFKDLYYEKDSDCNVLMHCISNKTLLSKVRYLYNEIYSECSRCLDLWDKNGTVSDLTLKKYNAVLEDAVKCLGLDCIYFADKGGKTE